MILATLGLLLVLGLAAALWVVVAQDRRAELDRAGLRLYQQARLAGDAASRALETADLALVAIVAEGRIDGRAAASLLPYMPFTDAVEVWGADARLRHRVPDRAGPPAVPGAFLAHHRDRAESFLLQPIHPPGDGAPWRLGVSRRIDTPGGAFAGIARALISTELLGDAFAAEFATDADRLLLIDADRLVLADSAPRGRRAVGRPLDAALPMLSATAVSQPGETESALVAWYRLHDFPLQVVAVRHKDALLARWRKVAAGYAAAAAALLAASLLAAALFYRQERRQATIAATLRLHDRAMDAANDGIIITERRDGHFPIIYCNPAFERITGYAAAELRGKDPGLLHRDEDEQPEVAQIRAAAAAETGTTVELRNYRKDGTPYWAEMRITPVRDRDGTVTHFLGIHRDVTTRRRAAEELLRTNAELVASNAELEQFAYVASHDLQEPLRHVAAYVQMLERRYQGKLDAEAHDYIGYAVSGVKRMQALIVDLLEYSRVTRQGRPFGRIDLGACLDQALADVAQAIRESGATVAAAELPAAWGDQGQITRLFANLIGNAVKYRKPDVAPVISISVQPAGDRWEITVADNGIGIDPAYADRIFALFQRLHPVGQYSGTGIGLTICKRIVERHGGTIRCESEGEGEGARLVFTLPPGPAE
ncbi:ATP-binding protein [Magnetospirillum sp. UT-4]|uniref:ATP-binding protein n=1 Tax=Magnetospirillum sp. UT-4 TaxID=2681467 RepID=UPI00137E7A45|nr:ATP-binding protein [Magnetospirillum sp. UT-4]CAA7621239.1 conserved exported hypothetical protein [Magnetospirillum sp. UT-4]